MPGSGSCTSFDAPSLVSLLQLSLLYRFLTLLCPCQPDRAEGSPLASFSSLSLPCPMLLFCSGLIFLHSLCLPLAYCLPPHPRLEVGTALVVAIFSSCREFTQQEVSDENHPLSSAKKGLRCQLRVKDLIGLGASLQGDCFGRQVPLPCKFWHGINRVILSDFSGGKD